MKVWYLTSSKPTDPDGVFKTNICSAMLWSKNQGTLEPKEAFQTMLPTLSTKDTLVK